jgi:hypothetical protein
MKFLKVIPRIEKETGDAILFLPQVPACYGMVTCYAHIGQHSEADVGYFSSGTRKAKSESEKAACAALVREYDHLTGDADWVPLRVMQRLNRNDLKWS